MSIRFDPDVIERQLLDAQREITAVESRAFLFNLVIMCHKDNHNEVDIRLQHLLGKRAARLIRIEDGHGDDGIDTTARCFEDAHERSVCFQEIIIQNGPENAGLAVGTWSTLLIRDIPTYVMWLLPVLGNEALLTQIQESTEKIIVDSDLMSSRMQASTDYSARKLLRSLDSRIVAEGSILSDFAWRRLLPLRRITARVFDRENTIEYLGELTGIKVRGGTDIHAELYVLWLASRLNWTLEAGGFVDEHGRAVAYEHSDPSDIEVGVEVVFTLESGEEIDIAVAPNGCADIDLPGEDMKRKVYQLPNSGEILLSEVDHMQPDGLYLEALHVLADDRKG